MKQDTYVDTIENLTNRALWEVKNAINCVPDNLWDRCYCQMPMWKHIYHMLHSLDLWFINPRDKNFVEPSIHEPDLNNLDVISKKKLSRYEIVQYYSQIEKKIKEYIIYLKDEELLLKPENCEYTRFTLILAQYRHLHTHLGMIMGFIIEATGKWPRVVGLEYPIPSGEYDKFC